MAGVAQKRLVLSKPSGPKSVSLHTLCTCTMHIHVYVHVCDCLGCAVLLCLVCLFDLACFFLSSPFHLSFKNMYLHVHQEQFTVIHASGSTLKPYLHTHIPTYVYAHSCTHHTHVQHISAHTPTHSYTHTGATGAVCRPLPHASQTSLYDDHWAAKQERGETHCTCTCIHVYIREMQKKEASKVIQTTTQSNTAHQGSHFSSTPRQSLFQGKKKRTASGVRTSTGFVCI